MRASRKQGASSDASTDKTIDIIEVSRGTVTMCLLGTSPLICNRMSGKGLKELLFPSGRKNLVERETTLKHNPLEEYRASPYIDKNEDGPTYIVGLAAWFKKAMMGAALDMPGATKAETGRLVWVLGERVSIYGIPRLRMDVVRQAGMNRTPDVRTRACLGEWACQIDIEYARPRVTDQAVMRLLAAAGMTQGVGDWRNEKGAGTHGSFVIVPRSDPKYRAIIATGGRAAQISAMEEPDLWPNDETETLYRWFQEELGRRRERQTAKSNGAELQEEAS